MIRARGHVGQRSSAETIAKLLVAFLEERTWKQKDLERRCGVSARAIRARILDLTSAGIPIDREPDHPHVYYSVAQGWFPERGTGLEHLDLRRTARLLGRLPRTPARDALLLRLVTGAFGAPTTPNQARGEVEDGVLELLEDAAHRKLAVRLGYYTASRGEHGVRTLSVQRILYGPPLRVIAYCHSSSTLKCFRADRMTSPQLDAGITFLAVTAREVDALVASSLDGYAERGDAMACTFFLQPESAHWITRNLPAGAQAVAAHEGSRVRISLHTSGIDVLARFLTGLGGMVSDIEPLELRRRVQKIALEAAAASGARLTGHSARPIRPAVSRRGRGA